VGYDRFKAAKKRRELRLSALDYKGNYCVICGYDGRICPSAMHFHHTDPLEKDFNISSKLASLASIKAELDKTVILCSRCHAEVHYGLHPGYLETEYPDYEYDYFDD
jgi:predicted HNH restriction endonuclease